MTSPPPEAPSTPSLRRVSAALGLAGLTAIATTQQATSSQVGQQDFAQFYGLYRRTQLAVLANSYSNVFLLTAATTLLAAVIALLLRSGPTEQSGSTAVPLNRRIRGTRPGWFAAGHRSSSTAPLG